MKFLKLPKFKWPKWNFHFKFPKLFSRSDSQKSFVSVWKRFISQIPRESRPTINSYQHFIILGGPKSGKSELIRGLIEQSQDLYPFDTSYTQDPDIQFYLGPNQVIQEISFASLEDKTIKGRSRTIKLWKKMYVRRDPIIVIAYDCLSTGQASLRDRQRLAQLIAGKISLLSEIVKKPIRVRIALTHLDKIPGYVEFARFLKQENLTFEISLSSDFQSNTLEAYIKKFFEDYVTKMLTSTSNRDFLKLITYSKELPPHFYSIEEFLRALVSRVSFENAIELDSLSFTSNQESSSSFNPFQWTRNPSMEIFFRYPLLKHQLASFGLLLILVAPLSHHFFKEQDQLELSNKIIDHLNLYHYHKGQSDLITTYVDSYDQGSKWNAFFKLNFFGEKLVDNRNRLAKSIRKHYIVPEYHRAVLEHGSEFKCLYFNALMHASSKNNLGRYFLENSQEIAAALNLDETILKAYILSCQRPNGNSESFNFDQANPFIPIASFGPWLNFFKKIDEISNQQIFMEQNFDEIVKDCRKLMFAVDRLKNDPRPSHVAHLFMEDAPIEGQKENIQVISWIGLNLDYLSSFLQFIEETAAVPVEIEDMNISQLFAKMKQMSAFTTREDKPYPFTLQNQIFLFHTKVWSDLVVVHNVERAIKKYIVLNANSSGNIFFKNTTEASPLQPILMTSFPYFTSDTQIPGRYTKLEYEYKVKATAEKLAHWIESLNVNPEDKKRFATFLVHEILNYVKTYQDHYEKYFVSCDIENISLENLKQTIQGLTLDSSNFHDFLKHICEQTSAFSEPIMNLKNMRDLNQFDFLTTVLSIESNQAPYAKYQAVMVDLLRDLESPSANGQRQSETNLTNLAKITSNMLQNNEQSYVLRMKQTLSEMGVPVKFQTAFLKPILHLYRLGLPDLKRCTEYDWSMKFETHINRLLSKFPFNPNSKETLSYQELEDTIHPKSVFYKKLQEVMSASCHKVDGTWVPLDKLDLHLDENMLTKVNQIQRVVDLLWDLEGNAQAIPLNFELIPFQNGPDDNPIVVQSYIVIGDQVVRNLNQAPILQTLKIEWWKTDNCTVGVELMNKYTNTSVHQNGPQTNGPWSFFELLRNAQMDRTTVTWNIANYAKDQNYQVALKFDKNPIWVLNQKS